MGFLEGIKNQKKGDPYWGYGLRTLDSSCGLGINEQFRYVYTKLSMINLLTGHLKENGDYQSKMIIGVSPDYHFLLDRSIYNNPIKDAFVIVENR